MGDIKMHYGNRLRLDVRYPGKPARGRRNRRRKSRCIT